MARVASCSPSRRAARARRPGNVGQAHLGARQEEEGAQGARAFTQDPARLGIGQPGHGGVHVPHVSRLMWSMYRLTRLHHVVGVVGPESLNE